ncbi:esterase/lipase family protein [Parvularcula bermudensis]|uniref:esterase/lipase family protein n=1 Tax=Parvularcula bermudensis TaxID=208216 RepID=UPI000323E5C1|nr:hypothetical protein [Parvularcula bermudensis]
MTRRISITLHGDRNYFEHFKYNLLDTFIDELAEILGAEPDTITNIKVSYGCVLIEADIDDAAAARLIELVNKFKNEQFDAREVAEFAEFFSKYDFKYCTSKKKDQGGRKVSKGNLAIFVHGLTGSSGSFGNMPTYIAQKVDCETMLYEYPSKRLRKSEPIFYVSRNLDNFIRNNKGGYSKIILIGHSMGGVILRDLLGQQLQRQVPLDSDIGLACFIASPLNGAWLAKLGKKLPSGVQSQVADLDPNSPYLTHVINQWNAWRKKGGSVVRVRSLYSQNDTIVDTASAVGDDPEAVPIQNVDHVSIVKPKSPNDEIVETLSRFISEVNIGND